MSKIKPEHFRVMEEHIEEELKRLPEQIPYFLLMENPAEEGEDSTPAVSLMNGSAVDLCRMLAGCAEMSEDIRQILVIAFMGVYQLCPKHQPEIDQILATKGMTVVSSMPEPVTGNPFLDGLIGGIRKMVEGSHIHAHGGPDNFMAPGKPFDQLSSELMRLMCQMQPGQGSMLYLAAKANKEGENTRVGHKLSIAGDKYEVMAGLVAGAKECGSMKMIVVEAAMNIIKEDRELIDETEKAMHKMRSQLNSK